MRVAVVRQPLRGQIERLVPARAPPAALAACADSNERMREPVFMLGVVPAVAALDAEPALVDRVIVGRVDVADGAVSDVGGEATADAAKGAGGLDDAVVAEQAAPLGFPVGAALEGAAGAHLHAVAAVDAGGVHHAVVLGGAHADLEPALGRLDGKGELHLVAADVDAAPAHDALVVVADVIGVVDVDWKRLSLGGGADREAIVGAEVRQLGRFAQVDAAEEQAQRTAARREHVVAAREDDLARLGLGSTGRQQLRCLALGGAGRRFGAGAIRAEGLLHHAQAAVGRGRQVGVKAERGDLDAGRGCRIQQRRARRNRHESPVNRQADVVGRHGQSPAPL